MPRNHTRKKRLVFGNLRQQALGLNTNQFTPADLDPATPDQVRYLLSLYRQLGQRDFTIAKWKLGIRSKVTEMTRTEAARLIDHLIGGPV